MRLRLAALVLLAAAPAFEAMAMAGGETARTLALESFSSVSTTDRIDVDIIKAATWSVIVHADSSVVDRIRVEVRGSVLAVALPAGLSARTRWYAAGARVEIGMPTLESLEIDGGSRGKLSMGIPEQDVKVRLSAGSILAGTLTCRSLDFQASAGDAELAGKATSLRLVATRRFRGDFSSLVVPRAQVELSEGSAAIVDATDELSVVASGGSGLRYIGAPKITRQELSGGAWIKQQSD